MNASIVVSALYIYPVKSLRGVGVDAAVIEKGRLKACTRCVATTTDQQTGACNSREPLLTLARYRHDGSTVVFGHYLMPERWGAEIRVGDPVRIVETEDAPSMGAGHR